MHECQPIYKEHRQCSRPKRGDRGGRHALKVCCDNRFAPYRREVKDDSSGFEHVFIGETRDKKKGVRSA